MSGSDKLFAAALKRRGAEPLPQPYESWWRLINAVFAWGLFYMVAVWLMALITLFLITVF